MSQDSENYECCELCDSQIECERCKATILSCRNYLGSCFMRDCAHKYEHLCESCGEIDPETDDNICYDCVQAKELKEQAKRIAKANEEAKAVLIAQGNKTPTNIQILKQRKLMESKGGL